MNQYAVFPYDRPDRPGGKCYADPTQILHRLRVFTNNQFEETVEQAAYLRRITLDPTDPEYQKHDATLPDHQRRLSEAYEAHNYLMRAARAAFDLPPYDESTGSGATDRTCCDLLNAFSAWVDEVQKKSDSTPSESPSAAGLTGCPSTPNSGSSST